MSVLQEKKEGLIFEKKNYLIIVIGVVIEIIGFLLMIGGKSEDPEVFNPEVFSTTRITIAPILVITGLVVVMFGIMKKPQEDK